MNSVALSLLLVMALPSDKIGGVNSLGQPVLEHCRVSLIEEAQVPGRETGALVQMDVREGQEVKKGDEIGRIDDTKMAMLKKVKERELEAALYQATNDVNVRFAEKAAAVAVKEWELVARANKATPGAIAAIEVDKLKLGAQKAQLSIEQAQRDMKVAKLTGGVKSAEVEAAEADIQLRRIIAPLDGVVVHVYKHLGEWVPPGDPVVHIVRIDRLRIEGFVNAADLNPSEVDGRSVTVDAELARGRKVRFTGKIVFVSPSVQAGGEYLVWAEVDNKQEDGHWLLRPGLTATMTIHLK